jgi:minimal PKS acyl carrier protein
MNEMTINDLNVILIECAGDPEEAVPLEQAPDKQFSDLGYDSLAMLETYSKIEQDYKISLPDAVGDLRTARDLVSFVNSLLAATAGSR